MNYECITDPYTAPRWVANDAGWTIVIYQDLDGDWRWDVFEDEDGDRPSAEGGYARTQSHAETAAENALVACRGDYR